ncbi:MAG: condensation domain-containing protein, partial [Pseudomonadales bacterium]|nr:condensation domain-containing protein [Pseudomonadales bacterium]
MTVAIDAFCRDNDVTLFMFLQTAFALLMARIGQQNDVLMGTPVACRSDQKFDQLMGLFVNTVIIRTKISKVGFSELLKQQKQVLLASFARQNMPLDLIIEDLNPPRNSCYNPLFQVVFSLSNENQNQLALGDLEVEPYVETAGTCRFDLELYAERRSDMIGLRWNYNTSLFKLQSVENWSEYFYLLLQEILKDSDKNVNELNLVPAEQAPLIHQALNSRSMLNEGTLPKVDVNLFTQIQKTALKHPQAIALQNENESLTYEQMAKYTVAYSAWLSDKLDSREEQAIGLAVEDPLKRSLLMLSIAAAGHVFVPLEKAIRDKNSHLLRGSWALLDAVVRDTEFSEPVCLEIDNKRDIPELELPELPELTDSWLTNFIDSRLHGKKQDGTQLLCLLPDEKAQCWVPIEHHNVLAVIQQEAFPLTSLSEFSLYIGKLNQLDSLFAFWADLLRGACIQFCSQNPVSIQRVFETYKVAARGLSIVTSTAVLKQGVLSDYLASGAISELICSSQTSSEEGELLLPYVDKVDSLSLVLSPTQAGKYRLYQVAKKDQPGLHQIKLNAILKASNRYRDFYLLDENLQAVPVGVAGKIYKADCLFAEVRDVGSANTCQKVTVPFSPKELVATGEYALWQVTEPGIHLHKIPALPTIKRLISKQEMSDNLIAGALQISGVKDALLFEAGERTQKQYIALACDDVSAKHLGLVTVRLQKLLSRLKKETETDISVNGFLTLPEIPRTAENQTDLAELQKLSSDPISLSSKKAAKTALQKRMLGIWSDILKAEDFGIGDDFFQLGGHSLLATRLVCEIEQKLGYSVSLKELFENSTIDELCRLLDRRDPVAQKSAIVKTSNEGPFPLSYAQQRLWFIDKLEGGSPKYNIPFALKLQGELNIDALQTAINDLIQRHEILRT